MKLGLRKFWTFVKEEKYLGDVISTDGRNIKDVKARIAKREFPKEL